MKAFYTVKEVIIIDRHTVDVVFNNNRTQRITGNTVDHIGTCDDRTFVRVWYWLNEDVERSVDLYYTKLSFMKGMENLFMD